MSVELKSNPLTQDNIIGKRLKRERDARELSQAALAKKADISRSAIAHYETGKVIPGGPELIKLADALEITPNYILSGSDDYFPSKEPEHALDVDDFTLVIRTGQCLQQLDREVKQKFSSLLMALVKEKMTDAEYQKFLEGLGWMEPMFREMKAILDPYIEKRMKIDREIALKEPKG